MIIEEHLLRPMVQNIGVGFIVIIYFIFWAYGFFKGR
jgi:hypothetical protein